MEIRDFNAHVTKQELLAAVKKLRQGQLWDSTEGICNNLEDTLTHECHPDTRAYYKDSPAHIWMRAVAKRWPKWSGDSVYPVPDSELLPDDAYQQYDEKWQGEYGDLRRELLDFLIEELENELR